MNAKEELVQAIADEKIICASISFGDDWDEANNGKVILKKDYTEVKLNEFLNKLDFEYNDGYGSQYLFGIVLLENGWLERHEYDGSGSYYPKCWVYKKRPEIPEECE